MRPRCCGRCWGSHPAPQDGLSTRAGLNTPSSSSSNGVTHPHHHCPFPYDFFGVILGSLPRAGMRCWWWGAGAGWTVSPPGGAGGQDGSHQRGQAPPPPRCHLPRGRYKGRVSLAPLSHSSPERGPRQGERAGEGWGGGSPNLGGDGGITGGPVLPISVWWVPVRVAMVGKTRPALGGVYEFGNLNISIFGVSLVAFPCILSFLVDGLKLPDVLVPEGNEVPNLPLKGVLDGS